VNTRQSRLWMLIFVLLLLPISVQAQETTPEPEIPPLAPTLTVEIEATDGIRLVGDYYMPHEGDAPVILLLHELYTTRASWRWQIEPLVANGFRVLAVDLRGYGQSRGAINWRRAGADTLLWLDWLYQQPGIRLDAVFVMGSSMGANLAMNACAEAEHCAGAVALSPGLNYFGVRTYDALTSGRSILLAYADRDSIPRRDVPRMWALVDEAEHTALISEIVYEGRAHGHLLFEAHDDLLPQIVGWIAERIP